MILNVYKTSLASQTFQQFSTTHSQHSSQLTASAPSASQRSLDFTQHGDATARQLVFRGKQPLSAIRLLAIRPATDQTEQAYQSAASFVPKLATKVVQWLDPQPDDVILDVGCGGAFSLYSVHDQNPNSPFQTASSTSTSPASSPKAPAASTASTARPP